MYCGQEKIIYGACHINGTWGGKELGQLKLSYEGCNPQREGPSLWGGVDASRHHAFKKKNLPFPGYFTSVY